MTAARLFTILAGIIGVLSLAIYLFGIPPELKRKMEKQALKTMGENKMSYIAKDQISKIPESDQEDVKQFKKGLGNAVGGAMNNPIGETTGKIAGQAWDQLQDYSKDALEQVSTISRRGTA